MGILFVESIKRLYIAGKITKNKIDSLYENGKITADDRDYILS